MIRLLFLKKNKKTFKFHQKDVYLQNGKICSKKNNTQSPVWN